MEIQMTWQHRSRKGGGPPLGLKNLGNTCYLNSVLQCLTYTPPLAQFCLLSKHSSLCKKVGANKDRECPFCLLEQRITRSLNHDGPQDAPSKIFKYITLFAENFCRGRQEDAHEFLRYVIDTCHDSCLKVFSSLSSIKANGKAPVTNGPSKGDSDGDRGTVMREIFGGELLSQVKCLGCKQESNTMDGIMDISLDLFQSNSLKDALGRFFHPEVLDGDNKYKCDNCKKLCVAKKQMFIQRAPNVLVIQLKRFEGIHGAKINRNIEFEEDLLLTRYMCSESEDLSPEYHLFGCIVHSGYSPESGHYYAYIKDACGRWYCCNDAHVSLSSAQEVLSEKVYILFYMRSNQRKTCKNDSTYRRLKSLETHGISTSSKLMSGESVKLQNASTPPRSNISGMSNGISSSQEVKPIVVKNGQLKSAAVNVNDKHEVHNNAPSNKCSYTPDENNNKVAHESNNCTENSNLMGKVDNIVSTETDGSLSSKVLQHEKRKMSLAAKEEEYRELIKNEPIENTTIDIMAVGKALYDDHKTDKRFNEGPGNFGIKRKLCQRDQSPSSESNPFPNENASHAVHSMHLEKLPELEKFPELCQRDQSPSSESNSLPNEQASHAVLYMHLEKFPELEKFKEMLAREASLGLTSCGWVDGIYSFMRARKKRFSEEPSVCHSKSELKKEMINDAKKCFLSQVPDPLKEYLLGLLKSYNHTRPLLDP